jgi:hypothetical protein
MTAHQTYVLRCDTCGVLYRADPTVRRAADVRTLAGADGWRHHVGPAPGGGPAPSKDYCRAHVGDAPVALQPNGRAVMLPADEAAYVAAALRVLLLDAGLPCADVGLSALARLEQGP